jgi:hypothetical protein
MIGIQQLEIAPNSWVVAAVYRVHSHAEWAPCKLQTWIKAAPCCIQHQVATMSFPYLSIVVWRYVRTMWWVKAYVHAEYAFTCMLSMPCWQELGIQMCPGWQSAETIRLVESDVVGRAASFPSRRCDCVGRKSVYMCFLWAFASFVQHHVFH